MGPSKILMLASLAASVVQGGLVPEKRDCAAPGDCNAVRRGKQWNNYARAIYARGNDTTSAAEEATTTEEGTSTAETSPDATAVGSEIVIEDGTIKLKSLGNKDSAVLPFVAQGEGMNAEKCFKLCPAGIKYVGVSEDNYYCHCGTILGEEPEAHRQRAILDRQTATYRIIVYEVIFIENSDASSSVEASATAGEEEGSESASATPIVIGIEVIVNVDVTMVPGEGAESTNLHPSTIVGETVSRPVYVTPLPGYPCYYPCVLPEPECWTCTSTIVRTTCTGEYQAPYVDGEATSAFAVKPCDECKPTTVYLSNHVPGITPGAPCVDCSPYTPPASFDDNFQAPAPAAPGPPHAGGPPHADGPHAGGPPHADGPHAGGPPHAGGAPPVSGGTPPATGGSDGGGVPASGGEGTSAGCDGDDCDDGTVGGAGVETPAYVPASGASGLAASIIAAVAAFGGVVFVL
ncbi:hypothetical protein MKZ38_006215 [Zalerion maritima]|uniref:Uncharacterized protein n=1 Tax=Zalerion maritima TaxID=339359 RepID=A0AAD5RXJ5_9PEZI|nr:hypothetical protein MKZ38_006215 [Zalerion maritima]